MDFKTAIRGQGKDSGDFGQLAWTSPTQKQRGPEGGTGNGGACLKKKVLGEIDYMCVRAFLFFIFFWNRLTIYCTESGV